MRGIVDLTTFSGDLSDHTTNKWANLFAATTIRLTEGRKLTSREKDSLSDALVMASEARGDDPLLLKALIALGADVNARENFFGRPALVLCATRGYTSKMRLLIESGADINAGAPLSPLHYAVSNNRKEAADLLRASGALPLVRSGIDRVKVRGADSYVRKSVPGTIADDSIGYAEKESIRTPKGPKSRDR